MVSEYRVDFKLHVHHFQNARLRSRKLSFATVESIVGKVALTWNGKWNVLKLPFAPLIIVKLFRHLVLYGIPFFLIKKKKKTSLKSAIVAMADPKCLKLS